MNTRFLETLIVLARVGSFRETAEVLQTTQAAISKRIEALEDYLNVQLLDRRQRTLKFTAVAETVLRHAERILTHERELRRSTHPSAAPTGRVRVGIIETAVHTWLTPLIRMLSERYPAIDPDLTVDTARNLREQFRQHRLDLLIQNDPLEAAAGNLDIVVTPVSTFPIRWVCRRDFAPQCRTWCPESLETYPVLTFSRTSSPHAHVKALFVGRESQPRVCSFPSVTSILQLAMDGFGVAAIPPIFVRPQLESRLLEIRDGPSLPALPISLTHLRGASPAVRAVADVSHDVVADYCKAAGPDWADLISERALEPNSA